MIFTLVTYWKLVLFLCSLLTTKHFHGCHGRRAFVASTKPTWKTTTNFIGGSTQSRSSKGKTDGDGTAGKKARQQSGDRFVQAAPLMVAVACQDGVLLVAAHTSDNDEPLLFFSHVDHDAAGAAAATSGVPAEETTPSQRTDEADDDDHPTPGFYRDLPLDYAGPFRVQALDRFGTTLVCTGWRADCDTLVHRAKALSAREVSQFGPPLPPVSADCPSGRRLGGSSLGFIVSTELSLYLAKCATSESTRTRSCAGLLATPGGGLWLVDATGVYAVRALCMGGGSTASDSDSAPHKVSERVNQRLLEVDWTQLDGATAVRRLLLLLEKSCGNNASASPPFKGSQSPLLCQGTRLEACFVSPSNPPMARLLLKNDTTKPLAAMTDVQ